MAHDDGYLLDNRQAEAGTRFDALSRLFDPSTFRHIEELGIRICPDEYGPEQRLANKLRFGFRSLLAQRGADLGYGRKLPRLLREAGLIDVKADAFFPITSPACAILEITTINQTRGSLIAHGYATAEEVERHLDNISAGRLDLATAPMISVWGQRR